jgi:4-diphosphocytidyl-2-C-methyl-D-erythritol kinase
MFNQLFSLHLTVEKLQEYAGRLGADCSFFITNLPVLATGRGDQLKPVSMDLSGFRMVIVKPPVSVNTAKAYQGIVPHIPEIHLADIIKQPSETWKNCLRNDFENFIFCFYPEIAGIKAKLYDLGALYVSMSGSGSAVFGLFSQEPENIKQHFPDSYTIFTA